MPNFIEFKKRSGRPGYSQMLFTIQKGGTFSLNDRTYEGFGSPKHAVLLFDPDEQIIALRPATDEDLNPFPIHRQGEGSTYLINGLGFCQYWEIPVSQGRRYRATLDENGWLLVDLKGEFVEVTSNRNRNQAAMESSDEQAAR